MTDDTVHTEASKVTAKEGTVAQRGPDQVDVQLTPEAAQETSDRLLEGAMKAKGQKRLKNQPHRPK
jgi:hypothetical protein